MSIPVIGSIVGTVGGILLIKMLMGKKQPSGPRKRVAPDYPGFPSLKKWGSAWAKIPHIQVHRIQKYSGDYPFGLPLPEKDGAVK